jgi:hypothetical protein
MGIKSINEPDGPGRTTMLTPRSINEPAKLPEGEIPEPHIEGIEPDVVELGSPNFRVYLTGTDFFAASVIVFAGHDEPTTLEDDGSLSTGVNMAVWGGPDVVDVAVRNGNKLSNAVEFAFEEPANRASKSKPKR